MAIQVWDGTKYVGAELGRFGTNGTLARPSVMPMDAWRDGDTFHVEFDLPGVDPASALRAW